MIEPGMIYEKDGWHVVVHNVSETHVYYQRFPPGVEEQSKLDNLGRTPIAEFEAAVKDAKMEADHANHKSQYARFSTPDYAL